MSGEIADRVGDEGCFVKPIGGFARTARSLPGQRGLFAEQTAAVRGVSSFFQTVGGLLRQRKAGTQG